MLNIVEEYNRAFQARKAEWEAVDAKIEKSQEEIERIKRRIERLQKKRSKIRFQESWVQGIVDPLAQELAARAGLCYTVYGPFGLRCETTIYLCSDLSKSITEQVTRSITLTPGHDAEDNYVIYYDTGEVDEGYQKGSVGYLNGFQYKTAQLPDTIEEVEALLRTSGPSD